jgi:hypothetical protein
VRHFASIDVLTAHFRQHTEITFQDAPNREYTLRLFVDNVERELQCHGSHTWTPVPRPYVPYLLSIYAHQWICMCRDLSPISQIRAEIRMKRGHSFWATHQETNEVIYLQGLFSDYWGSHNDEFTVLSQSLSLTMSRISDREGQSLLSLESIEVL